MVNRFDKYKTPVDQDVKPLDDNNRFAKYIKDADKTEQEVQIESGEWLETDNFSTAMAFMQGVSLGWYDEYRVGITALAESAFGDETYQQAYDRNRAEYDEVAENFKKRQPVVSAGAEIAGAVVSPVAKIKTASTLGSLVARGAAEGGIYGAGSAESVEKIPSKFVEGAGFGAIGGGIIGSGGWLLKRKVASPLETDGVFTPITLAAQKDKPSEALLQSFYRDVVGPSFGGKGVIRGQEEVIVAPLALKQAERKKELKNFIRASKAEGAEASAQLNRAVADIKETGKIKIADVKTQEEISKEVIGGRYDKFLGKEGEIISRKTEQLKRNVENNNDMLRLAAFESSLPVGIKKLDVSNVLESPTPNVAMHRLEKLWQKEGFRSIKDISFRIKPQELLTQIEKKVAEDTTLSLLAGKSSVRSLLEDGLSTLSAKRNPKTGRVKGEDLSAIRNSFGMAASKMSDEGGQAVLIKGLYREIQNVIDENMKKQLSGKRLASFEADLSGWASQSVLRNAVTKASTKAGRQGRFTPDEWITSIKSNSPRQARRGEGPLRAEAEQIAALTAKQEEAVVTSANALSKKLAVRRTNEIKRVRNKAISEKSAILKQTASLERNLRNNPEFAERIARNFKREDELTDVIESSKKELDDISRLRTPETPTWFHQMAASGIIGTSTGATGLATGGGMAGAGAGMSGIIGTVATAKGLASPSAQKFLAGQTGLQQSAQRGLKQQIPMTGMQAVDVIKSFPRAGVGMLSREE